VETRLTRRTRAAFPSPKGTDTAAVDGEADVCHYSRTTQLWSPMSIFGTYSHAWDRRPNQFLRMRPGDFSPTVS
jgi:hypothetical protein